MPEGPNETHYTATVRIDTAGLFEPMEATIDIPVKNP